MCPKVSETRQLKPRLGDDDPLFGVLTEEQVGVDANTGSPRIVDEVLNEIGQYLLVQDPTERKVREERVRRSIAELDGDLHGQKTLLRLEPASIITKDLNKGKGVVFGFKNWSQAMNANEKLMGSAIHAGQAMTWIPIQDTT